MLNVTVLNKYYGKGIDSNFKYCFGFRTNPMFYCFAFIRIMFSYSNVVSGLDSFNVRIFNGLCKN